MRVLTEFRAEIKSQIRAAMDNAHVYQKTAEANLAAAERLKTAARWACNQRGTKWVDVSKIKLKIGQRYITRRVYLYPKRRAEAPSIALWTDRGWQVLCGRLEPTTGTATIEVWK